MRGGQLFLSRKWEAQSLFFYPVKEKPKKKEKKKKGFCLWFWFCLGPFKSTFGYCANRQRALVPLNSQRSPRYHSVGHSCSPTHFFLTSSLLSLSLSLSLSIYNYKIINTYTYIKAADVLSDTPINCTPWPWPQKDH